METLWFCLVAFMIAGYVVLDGFDLGAGAIHLWVARTDRERRMVFASIGPVWDGNEVWLIAGGGTLYFAFPALYAASFSGFYLPLTIVLWLFILRGCSIEFRAHLDNPVWVPFWDVVFSFSSALLAIFFGAALGNVIRGVPIEQSGEFFLPLWTDFSARGEPGILDWYTIVVGLTAFATLTLHGALWVKLKTTGAVAERSARIVPPAWIAVAVLTAATTVGTIVVQPKMWANFVTHPWGAVFPIAALAGLLITLIRHRGHHERDAFLGSALFITGMLASAGFSIYPYLLPSLGGEANGITIYETAASRYGLAIGLWWWIPGMVLAVGYSVFVYRRFAGKVTA